jgi:AhpD family alkylhydroperoxidase
MTEHSGHEESSIHDHETVSTSYGRAVQDELREPARALRQMIPAVYEDYVSLGRSTYSDGALDAKTKQLIALAVSVRAQCDGCIASHARGAARAGASAAEVAETLGVCIHMMGGPGTVYAPRAFAAFREFADTPLVSGA